MGRPPARPAASSQRAQSPSARTEISRLRVANDSAPLRSSRVTARQLDAIRLDLTTDDTAVLEFLADVRSATGQQLARRLWASRDPRDVRARAARRALRRLEDWRAIDRLPQRIGGVRAGSSSIVYRLGPIGRRLLARGGFEPKRLAAPGDRFLRHTLAITELVVRLSEATLAGELDLIAIQTEPRCWRPFVGVMGARAILKPDLFARIGAGAMEDRYFIEVDLATEAQSTLLGKATQYVSYFRSSEEQRRYGVFPRVVWLVPDSRRAEQLSEALARLPQAAKALFSVWRYDEAIGRFAAEASS
jgi:hypothetical protein